MEYEIDDLYKIIFETLQKSAQEDLIAFLEKFNNVKNYFIISDYCIGDKTKYNDVYSFVIMPKLDLFEDYKKCISASLPKDYKNTRTLTSENLAFLSQLPFLSINILIPKEYSNILKRTNNKEEFERIIYSAIEMFNAWIVDNPANEETYQKHIKKYKKLLQESKQKSFNLNLYIRSFFTSTIAAFITHAIEKYTNVTGIVWGTDRDSMLSSNDGILYDNYSIQHNGFARNDKDWEYNEKCKIGIMNPANKGENWFDELIRVPDFCAGALSSVIFLDEKDSTANCNNHYEPTEQQIRKAFDVLKCIKPHCINIILRQTLNNDSSVTYSAGRLEYVNPI